MRKSQKHRRHRPRTMASHTDLLDDGIDVEVDVTDQQDLRALHTPTHQLHCDVVQIPVASRAGLSSERSETSFDSCCERISREDATAFLIQRLAWDILRSLV